MAAKVSIGCDHAGIAYKQILIDAIKSLGFEVIDCGTMTTDRCDYPDFAEAAAKKVVAGEAKYGVLICGTGIGISIAANKVDGIRCGLCHDHLTAMLCRQHNNANMVALGARMVGPDVAVDIVKTFLTTEFEGGRHTGRVEKIMALEKKQ